MVTVTIKEKNTEIFKSLQVKSSLDLYVTLFKKKNITKNLVHNKLSIDKFFRFDSLWFEEKNSTIYISKV